MKQISIVVPVFNEQENVIALASEFNHTMRNSGLEWEVIWVDDCSTDDTVNVLTHFALVHPQHKVLSMPARSGQSSAVLNGIHHASYSLIGTLDGDGQNAPLDLLILYNLLRDTGILLAQGRRVKRNDSPLRRLSTKIANSVRRTFTNDTFNDVGCAVRVFHKDIVRGLPAFKGWHRFFPVMISELYPGMVMENPVSHRPRLGGISKYGVWNRAWVGIYDLVGMAWFRHRRAQIYSNGVCQWKTTSMPSVLLARSSSPEGFSFNGSQANVQTNQ